MQIALRQGAEVAEKPWGGRNPALFYSAEAASSLFDASFSTR